MKNGWIKGAGIDYHYENDQLHKLDGPAIIEYYDGGIRNIWCFKGERLTCTNQQEFERIIKLKVFW